MLGFSGTSCTEERYRPRSACGVRGGWQLSLAIYKGSFSIRPIFGLQ